MPLVQQPVVKVTDAYGNSVSNNTAVAVAETVPANGNVQGSLTQITAGGVAAYTNLFLTNSGGSTLTFVSGSASVASGAIVISPGVVTQLGWTTRPECRRTNGAPFGIQPVLQTVDVYGNPSTVRAGGDANGFHGAERGHGAVAGRHRV